MRVEGQMRSPMATTDIGSPRTFGRVPVIMVNFRNMSFRIGKDTVDSLFNAQNFTMDGATGSVRQYFYDQSNGAYNPQFDVYGPVTLSQRYGYYGNKFNRSGLMVLEACQLMNDSLDFSQYDLNQDGYVDMVYIFYAGPPASDGNYIDHSWIPVPDSLVWPHYWTINNAGTGGYSRVFDGKTINDFEVSNELDGMYSNQDTTVMAGIGVACHEFGHGMGLPDVYATNSSNYKTSGMWDIMDYACYNNNAHTPANYTAYERAFMGWTTPELLVDTQNVVLPALSDSNRVMVITGNSSFSLTQSAPYYLLENRQRTGWDSYVPGHGLIVTKISYNAGNWSGNRVNNNANSLGIDIIEADGQAPDYPNRAWFGKAGDAFPAGATSFTPYIDYPMTEIEESEDGLIMFKFRGGRDVPTQVEQTEIEDETITAIYDLSGRYMGKQPEGLHGGIYIVRTLEKTYRIIK